MQKNSKKQVMVGGTTSHLQLGNGLEYAQFDADFNTPVIEPCVFTAKVERMRDGSLYVTQKRRRKKNKPIFRDDNSSLSLGTDGKYYFYFALPEQLVNELPAQLIRQATAIARKVINEIINKEEVSV